MQKSIKTHINICKCQDLKLLLVSYLYVRNDQLYSNKLVSLTCCFLTLLNYFPPYIHSSQSSGSLYPLRINMLALQLSYTLFKGKNRNSSIPSDSILLRIQWNFSESGYLQSIISFFNEDSTNTESAEHSPWSASIKSSGAIR